MALLATKIAPIPAGAITSLIDAGCTYFVCFGPTSEEVHNRVDDVLMGRVPTSDIQTTWHDDEPIAEVLDFFFDVVGAAPSTLLVALVDVDDVEVTEALTQKASQDLEQE